MSSMIPDTDWHATAEEFGRSQGRQVILCAPCVAVLGMTTPPTQVIVYEGESLCLEHFNSAFAHRTS